MCLIVGLNARIGEKILSLIDRDCIESIEIKRFEKTWLHSDERVLFRSFS